VVTDGEGSGGGDAVEKSGAVRLPSGERERERERGGGERRGKLDLRELTTR
jgi:hypothetical protein